MIRGLYAAASGMVAAQQRNDVTSDNVANINTPGFKKSVGAFKTFSQELVDRVEGTSAPGLGLENSSPIGSLAHGVMLDQVSAVLTAGTLLETGVPTHLALEGPGYFQVSTPDGVRYTRNGDFRIDAAGNLVTTEGYAVLGSKGVIRGLTSGGFTVLPDGNIRISGQIVNSLAVVDFPPDALRREGNGLFSAQGQPLSATDYKVRQKYLEQSNVDVAEEMTNLITVQRSYQANQRMIQTLDATLDKAVNEIAKI